jgi:cytochrome c-type biogenesis protein CcmH/NrfF
VSARAERQSYHGLNEPSELPLNRSWQKGPAETKKPPLNPTQKEEIAFITFGLRCPEIRRNSLRKESGDHMRSLLLNVRNRVKRLDGSCRVAAQFNTALEPTATAPSAFG